MVNILLHLANYGINILRLDAIAFMWKELGTSCRNLPEAHDMIAMMHLIKNEVCPSVVLLGEAIVEPHEIVKYFGEDTIECGLLYNANLMVNLFHTFATRDTTLLEIDQMKFKSPSEGCFINYARCHDDIGWGLNEDVLRSMDNDPHEHKKFLNDFYSGTFKGSFSEGEIYQYNPMNEDARINGTLASLLGLGKYLTEKNQPGILESIQKITMAHGLILFEQGIPLIYSGDELGQLNDKRYLIDEHKRNDGRWLHRGQLDWKKAEDRNTRGSVEYQIFSHIKSLIKIRQSESLFHASISNQVVLTTNSHVYVTLKRDGKNYVLGLYNFSENNQYLDNMFFRNQNIKGQHTDLVTGKQVSLDEELRLYPYEFMWLKLS
jgi:glycosidase